MPPQGIETRMRTTLLLAAAVLGTLAAGCTDGRGPPARSGPATPEAAPVTSSPATPVATTAASPGPAIAPAAASAATFATANPTRSPRPVASPTPGRTPGAVHFIDALAGQRFDRPTDAAAYPGGRVLIAEQSGLVLLLDAATAEGHVFLDLRAHVSRSGNEEGLLALALDPEFAATGSIYAYYSVRDGERRTRLSRFTASGGIAEPASELVVLEIEQPFSNHNGGAVRFGPDGMLYLGVGDGGAAGDPGGNGQNPGTLLGSILRIDVRASSTAEAYRVPADNPFVGIEAARPEIWAYGFRNPWRMAFDAESGALWAGDVGQNRIEEVDLVVRGGNYGWNRLEGDECHQPPLRCDREGTEPPVATYDHRDGCSISGGVVYRDGNVPELEGTYVFGDFCSGRVWAMDASGTSPAVPVAETGTSITSFAQIGDELWLLRFGGPVLRAVSP